MSTNIVRMCDTCTHCKKTFVIFGRKYCEKGSFWFEFPFSRYLCVLYDPKLIKYEKEIRNVSNKEETT